MYLRIYKYNDKILDISIKTTSLYYFNNLFIIAHF